MSLCGNPVEWCETIKYLARGGVLLGLMSVLLKEHFTLPTLQFVPRDAMHKRGICRHAVSVRLAVCLVRGSCDSCQKE